MSVGRKKFLKSRHEFSEPIFCMTIGMFLFLSLFFASAMWAQQRDPSTSASVSDLTLQNLSRVAASATEIKGVLLKDPGLMVELKRWVARDSSEHGQIVGDGELNDDAIFDRLESDVQFRSVATALVQRYGYLIPKINPESDLAKEQDLLRVERTKWMAQAEEEQRAQERQKAEENLKKASACQALHDADCNPTQAGNQAPAKPAGQIREYESSPYGNFPGYRPLPEMPSGNGANLQRTQLMQTGDSYQGNLSQNPQLSLANAPGGSSYPNTMGMGSFGSIPSDSGDSGTNKQLAGIFSGQGGQGMSGPSDGMF